MLTECKHEKESHIIYSHRYLSCKMEFGLSNLILVRHSIPKINPDIPSFQWHLSDEGRKLCFQLAENLKVYTVKVIFTSPENKAQETAKILASQLGNVPVNVHDGLREHDRRNVSWVEDSFDELMRMFYKHPAEKVFGLETALQAAERIEKAIEDCWKQEVGYDKLIVSHGTVMSLYVSRVVRGVTPFEFWKQLKMPMAMVLNLPPDKIISILG